MELQSQLRSQLDWNPMNTGDYWYRLFEEFTTHLTVESKENASHLNLFRILAFANTLGLYYGHIERCDCETESISPKSKLQKIINCP